MRKIIVSIGILIVLFIIVAALAVLNLNFFINGNKDYFLSQIEQSLGRKLQVAQINTGFRDGLGIRLKNVSISDDPRFSDKDFIRASDIQINVKLIPLLAKKINISKLILNKPFITVIENKNGEYNFETLGNNKKSKGDKSSQSSDKKSPLSLFASSIIVQEGQINFIDQRNETNLQLQKIDLDIKDLGFENKIPINLAAAVLSSEQNLDLDAVISPISSDSELNEIQANGELHVSELNISTLKKFLPVIDKHIPKGLDLSGPVAGKLEFAGTLESISFNRIGISASVFGASVPNFELSGKLGPLGSKSENFSLDTKFSLQKANISKLRNFSLIKDSIPNSLSTQGTLNVSGRVSGSAEDLEFNQVKIDATLSRLAMIGKFFKPKDTPFSITASGEISDSVVVIKRANINIDNLDLSANGEINRGVTNLLNISVSSNKIDLASMSETFPSIKEYKPTGYLKLEPTNLTGELGKGQIPQIKGSLNLEDVSLEPESLAEPLRDINTKINFTGRSADVGQMTLRMGNSKLNLTSKIDSFSPLVLSYKVSSPQLYLSDFSKEEVSTNKAQVLRDFKSEGKVSNKSNNISVLGKLSSSEADLSDFELENLNAKFNLIGESLKIEEFSTKAYQGSIKGKASYGFGKNPDFTLISKAVGIDLTSFLSSSDNKIEGKANLDINIFGSGKDWTKIKNTLKGTAKAEIVNGAVLDINIADQVLKGITGIEGLTFLVSEQTKEKYPQVFTAQDTEFDEFKSSFIIEKGKMETTNLRISSKDYTITGKGWMNLDGKIDLKSLLTLSEQLSLDLETDIPDLRLITNDNNRVEIPYVIAGVLPNAKAKPDVSYLSKLIQRAGIRKVLDGLTSGSDESAQNENPPDTDQPPKKEEKRLDEKLFDELKDLF
ncbi:MAG: AsmA family protein [Thermodesulfobacteriota bacterium]